MQYYGHLQGYGHLKPNVATLLWGATLAHKARLSLYLAIDKTIRMDQSPLSLYSFHIPAPPPARPAFFLLLPPSPPPSANKPALLTTMTTTATDCFIQNNTIVCSADTTITFAGQVSQIDADLACPIDVVQQSDFVTASQLGLCDCTTALLGNQILGNQTLGNQTLGNQTDDATTPIDCQCFACPTGSRLAFALQCEVPIVGPCFNFSCSGECNGDLGIMVDFDTFAPTQAPTKPLSGGSNGTGVDQDTFSPTPAPTTTPSVGYGEGVEQDTFSPSQAPTAMTPSDGSSGDLGLSVDQDTFSPTQAPIQTPSGARAMAGGDTSGMVLPAMMIGYLLVDDALKDTKRT
jgi:hypothetical protein